MDDVLIFVLAQLSGGLQPAGKQPSNATPSEPAHARMTARATRQASVPGGAWRARNRSSWPANALPSCAE